MAGVILTLCNDIGEINVSAEERTTGISRQ